MAERSLGMEAEVVCRMAFEPESLARTVQALADQGVMVLGYTFDPGRARGQARFWTTDPPTAVLTLEALGLDPRVDVEDRSDAGSTTSTAQALRSLSQERSARGDP